MPWWVAKRLLNKSAIVLAGGFPSRFSQDKGVLEFAGKPLIRHVVDAVRRFVDEVIVVVESQEQRAKYTAIASADVRFVFDSCEPNNPLSGALAGFEVAQGKYVLLLPFDLPFVSADVVGLLFDLCIGKAAVVPRWTDGRIEPLHAVYQTEMALAAAQSAVNEEQVDLQAMFERMRGVRYVSTLVIQQLDPDFRTFFKINTPVDLKKAMSMLKPRKAK
jgi:molybdopterin-guanine dinucleotide biosynthesis protein A